MIVTQALKRCNERTAEARFATNFRSHRSSLVILVALCSFASVSRSADTQAHNITAGEAAKVQGVIESRDGNKIQLRENPSTVVVLITDSKTHITMRSGLWGMSRKDMDSGELLPGLYVSAEGRGGEHGELMTSKIFFDPSDLKAARSADSRVRPVEGRAGALEAPHRCDTGPTARYNCLNLHVPGSWNSVRSVRNPRAHRRGRHGGSVSSSGHEAQPRRGTQSPAGGLRSRCQPYGSV